MEYSPQEKIRFLRKLFEETAIEGWGEFAAKLPINGEEYSNFKDAIFYKAKLLKKMAFGDLLYDKKSFNKLILSYLVLYGRCMRMYAEKLSAEYSGEVPDKVFRFLPRNAKKKKILSGREVDVIPYHVDGDNSKNLSLDEYNYLKKLDLKPLALENILLIKEIFLGAQVAHTYTDFIREVREDAGDSVWKSAKKVTANNNERSIRLPVEEQQWLQGRNS